MQDKLVRYKIFTYLHIGRHSLDFSVSSPKNDERRRDYRVEDSIYRELAHERTQAHAYARKIHFTNNYPQTKR